MEIADECHSRKRRRDSPSPGSNSSYSRSRSREKDLKQDSKRYKSSRNSRSRHRRAPRRSRSYSRSPSYHRRTRYYGTRENPYKSRVVGVFGLPSQTHEANLMDVFSRFGPIEHVSIIHDAKTGNSRGFGFVYFSQIEHASRARSECNGMTIEGRRIRVDYSITKRAHTPTPGVYMGSSHSRDRSRRRTRSRSPKRRSRSRSRSMKRRTRSRSQRRRRHRRSCYSRSHSR